MKRLLATLLLALALVSPALAHRINSLSVTVDVAPDGRSAALEVSAEAKRILEAKEALSLLPRLQAGGATADEVSGDVFSRAQTYFEERAALLVDDATFPLPQFDFSTLVVDEKDAVDPGQADQAGDTKHLFVVGKKTVTFPDGARVLQMSAIGDTVCVLRLRVDGQDVGRVVPYFIGQMSKPFQLPRADSAAPPVVEEPGFAYYVHQGFLHILPMGLDHILFVLGLFFLTRSFKPLLWQVTAFTLAHSITLALAMLDVVSLPSKPVEIAIAASIAFVAIENLFHQKLTFWRPLVIFGFGLIHGLGFAGAFQEMLGEGPHGVSGRFIAMILAFNIGVELGQLSVIAIAFAVVGWFWKREWYRTRIAIPASIVIAGFGIYWAVERLLPEPADAAALTRALPPQPARSRS